MLAATTHPARHSSVHMHVPQRETPDNTKAELLRSLSANAFERAGTTTSPPRPGSAIPGREAWHTRGCTRHTHTHTHAHTHTHCTHIIYSRPHTHDAQSKQLARKVHLREASAELWGSQRAAGTAEVGADEIEGSAGRSPDITKPASHFSGAGDSAERARTCGRMTPVAPKLPIATRSGSRSLSAGRR